MMKRAARNLLVIAGLVLAVLGCAHAPHDPALAEARRGIVEANRRNRAAFLAKDLDALMALRTEDFHSITPDGKLHDRAAMKTYIEGFFERGRPLDLDQLRRRQLDAGGDQKPTRSRASIVVRMALRNDNQVHHVETWVTQRERWRQTSDGWKLAKVDAIRDQKRRGGRESGLRSRDPRRAPLRRQRTTAAFAVAARRSCVSRSQYHPGRHVPAVAEIQGVVPGAERADLARGHATAADVEQLERRRMRVRQREGHVHLPGRGIRAEARETNLEIGRERRGRPRASSVALRALSAATWASDIAPCHSENPEIDVPVARYSSKMPGPFHVDAPSTHLGVRNSEVGERVRVHQRAVHVDAKLSRLLDHGGVIERVGQDGNVFAQNGAAV